MDSNSPFYELSDVISKNMTLPPVVYLKPEECEQVEGLFATLKREYASAALWKDTRCKALIAELLICFDRSRRSTLLPDFTKQDNNREFEIWKVVQHIHAAFDTDIGLEELAKTFHYNPSYLNRLLKQNIGLNFDEILQEVRIRNACALLSYPLTQVNEIGLAVGYKSQETFYRAFKSVKGISPENYRKLYVYHGNGNKKVPTCAALNVQIVYYMHLHYNENLTLSTLARQFHYSEDYLREVLAENSMSFVSLLHEIRIFHACSLLRTTKSPVNEIGFNVGFDSTETFYRVFKKLRGITPGEYRKRAITDEQNALNVDVIDLKEIQSG